MEKMKEFFEAMERAEEKDRINQSWSDEGRTEDADKISDLEQKIRVYAKWKELCHEITELEKDDVEKFIGFLEMAVKPMKTIDKFSRLMADDDLENARNMVEEMQTSRNELATAAIKFLDI